jgi:hypothetical protein
VSLSLRILLCATLLPGVMRAQQPIALGKPDAEYSEPFTEIASVRELKNGRVLVVDSRDRSVHLVDLRANSAIRVGRNGAGPGEYARPVRVIALPGDSSAVYDADNVRYLSIMPDGKTGATFRIDLEWVRMGGRGNAPRGTDTRGRLFFEGSPFVSGAGGAIIPADSTPILRFDQQTRNLDTLAFVHLAKGNARASGTPGGGLMMMTGRKAFPSRDDWAPLPDGGVGIARVADYHVDRYAPSGTRTSGPSVRVDAIPVTDAEKKAWREARGGLALSLGRGGTSSGAPRPPPEAEFPAVMPPFVSNATMGAPNGDLWVLRSHRAADAPVYDVFSGSGQLVRRVSLAVRSRVVGFGNGTVYVVRRDEDDLHYLQRFRVR